MLSAIQAGKKLKKATTVDKSAPQIAGSKPSGGNAPSNAGGIGAMLGGGGGGGGSIFDLIFCLHCCLYLIFFPFPFVFNKGMFAEMQKRAAQRAERG